MKKLLKLNITELVFLIIVFFGLSVCCHLSMANECDFDPKGINKSYFLKNTKFTEAEWNDELKEARVTLSNYEQVIVQYGACHHFGMTAKHIMKNLKHRPSVDEWKNKIEWLGDKVLNKKDYDLLLKTLDNKEFNANLINIKSQGETWVDVRGSHYDEFVIKVYYSEEQSFVLISWYI